jgi:hypothetical protein
LRIVCTIINYLFDRGIDIRWKHIVDIYRINSENVSDICWFQLSSNENAISILEKHQKYINWHYLSGNPNAISILEKNIDKIDWPEFVYNKNGIRLLEKNIDILSQYDPVMQLREILSVNENAADLSEQYRENCIIWNPFTDSSSLHGISKVYNPVKQHLFHLDFNYTQIKWYKLHLYTFLQHTDNIDHIMQLSYTCNNRENLKEELMISSMSPHRLERHLALGGSIDDF